MIKLVMRNRKQTKESMRDAQCYQYYSTYIKRSDKQWQNESIIYFHTDKPLNTQMVQIIFNGQYISYHVAEEQFKKINQQNKDYGF